MGAVPEVEFILQRNALTRPLWAPFLEQVPPPTSLSLSLRLSLSLQP